MASGGAGVREARRAPGRTRQQRPRRGHATQGRGGGDRPEQGQRDGGGDGVQQAAPHAAGRRNGHRDGPVAGSATSADSPSARTQAAIVTPLYSLPSGKVAVVRASEQRYPSQRQALRPWQFVASRVEWYSTPRAV